MLCRLYHALRQPTRLGTARPVSTQLSVKIVKKVGGPKAEPPKRVRNRDVIHVTGITGIIPHKIFGCQPQEYTQPSLIRPSLIRPSLIRPPPSTGHLSSDIAMVNMVLTCTEKHNMLGHVRVGVGTCIMYMYVCMQVHVCASPCNLSYGRIRVTGSLRAGGARIREG